MFPGNSGGWCNEWMYDGRNKTVLLLLFCLTDGRGLRHKYFKDYKDYLGKWGNVKISETCTVTLAKAPTCMMSQWLLHWQVPVRPMLWAMKNNITSTWDDTHIFSQFKLRQKRKDSCTFVPLQTKSLVFLLQLLRLAWPQQQPWDHFRH